MYVALEDKPNTDWDFERYKFAERVLFAAMKHPALVDEAFRMWFAGKEKLGLEVSPQVVKSALFTYARYGRVLHQKEDSYHYERLDRIGNYHPCAAWYDSDYWMVNPMWCVLQQIHSGQELLTEEDRAHLRGINPSIAGVLESFERYKNTSIQQLEAVFASEARFSNSEVEAAFISLIMRQERSEKWESYLLHRMSEFELERGHVVPSILHSHLLYVRSWLEVDHAAFVAQYVTWLRDFVGEDLEAELRQCSRDKSEKDEEFPRAWSIRVLIEPLNNAAGPVMPFYVGRVLMELGHGSRSYFQQRVKAAIKHHGWRMNLTEYAGVLPNAGFGECLSANECVPLYNRKDCAFGVYLDLLRDFIYSEVKSNPQHRERTSQQWLVALKLGEEYQKFVELALLASKNSYSDELLGTFVDRYGDWLLRSHPSVRWYFAMNVLGNGCYDKKLGEVVLPRSLSDQAIAVLATVIEDAVRQASAVLDAERVEVKKRLEKRKDTQPYDTKDEFGLYVKLAPEQAARDYARFAYFLREQNEPSTTESPLHVAGYDVLISYFSQTVRGKRNRVLLWGFFIDELRKQEAKISHEVHRHIARDLERWVNRPRHDSSLEPFFREFVSRDDLFVEVQTGREVGIVLFLALLQYAGGYESLEVSLKFLKQQEFDQYVKASVEAALAVKLIEKGLDGDDYSKALESIRSLLNLYVSSEGRACIVEAISNVTTKPFSDHELNRIAEQSLSKSVLMTDRVDSFLYGDALKSWAAF